MSIKDFVVINQIGKGSYSSVYKVKRISDQKEYALKKVKLLALKDKEKSNALNEVRILASISNQHIVSYKQAFLEESTNSLCIIMEFANGGDLQQKIDKIAKKKGYFPESEVWKIAKDTLRGLKVLHDMKIVHRDIKTANIFISDGIYKLGDLNVSKILQKGLAYTQTGTPYYASPEVWRDQPYDGKSDIWSLGCVLFQVCSLKPPFLAHDMQGLFKKIQSGKFDRIPNRYTQDLQKFIQKCIQLNPAKRASCDELLKNPSISGQSRHSNEEQNNLLNTILVPKNLQRLKSLLPKSKYQQTQTTTQRIPSRKSDIDIHREGISLMNIRKNESQKHVLPDLILPKYSKIKGSSVDSRYVLKNRIEQGSYEFVNPLKYESKHSSLMKDRISALSKIQKINQDIEAKLIIKQRSIKALPRRDHSNSDRYRQPTTNPVKLPAIQIKQRPAVLSLRINNQSNPHSRPEWWG